MGIASYDYRVYYRYDENGSPIGFDLIKNGTTSTYTYVKNIQGDVVGIIDDSTGAQVVAYTYDAWGKITSITGSAANIVGKYNSLRYRGYYYDSETGYYYLQSRYYDPSYKRFINADEPELMIYLTRSSVLGGNLFAYCENNAVMKSDPSGCIWFYTVDEYENYYRSSWLWSFYRNRANMVRNEYNFNRDYINSRTNDNPNNNYVLYQKNENVKGLKYGYKCFDYNGCEIAATYNVMRFLGKKQPLQRVILEFSINGLQWLRGILGTESKDLMKYFDAHDIKYSHYDNLDKFKKNAAAAKICIMSYWNSPITLNSGIHTIALYYDKSRKTWFTFNLSKKNTKDGNVSISCKSRRVTWSSIDEILSNVHNTNSNRRFIRGYCFG